MQHASTAQDDYPNPGSPYSASYAVQPTSVRRLAGTGNMAEQFMIAACDLSIRVDRSATKFVVTLHDSTALVYGQSKLSM